MFIYFSYWRRVNRTQVSIARVYAITLLQYTTYRDLCIRSFRANGSLRIYTNGPATQRSNRLLSIIDELYAWPTSSRCCNNPVRGPDE